MQKIPISYQDILSIIKRLLMVAEEYNEPFGEPIVMVGGTAMTAHRIRKQSFNVDLYARIFSDDVIHQVEQEFREQFGSMFKIDVTSTENIWGMIMLRDIHKSEPDTMIQVGDNQYTIQK
jgi:predicted nucleotidyltransferase component of viral defense system